MRQILHKSKVFKDQKNVVIEGDYTTLGWEDIHEKYAFKFYGCKRVTIKNFDLEDPLYMLWNAFLFRECDEIEFIGGKFTDTGIIRAHDCNDVSLEHIQGSGARMRPIYVTAVHKNTWGVYLDRVDYDWSTIQNNNVRLPICYIGGNKHNHVFGDNVHIQRSRMRQHPSTSGFSAAIAGHMSRGRYIHHSKFIDGGNILTIGNHNTKVRMHDFSITQSKGLYALEVGANSMDVRIHDYDILTKAKKGVIVQNDCHNVRIHDGSVEGALESGIETNNSQGVDLIRQVSIHHNDIFDCATGVTLHGTAGYDVTDNHFYDCIAEIRKRVHVYDGVTHPNFTHDTRPEEWQAT